MLAREIDRLVEQFLDAGLGNRHAVGIVVVDLMGLNDLAQMPVRPAGHGNLWIGPSFLVSGKRCPGADRETRPRPRRPSVGFGHPPLWARRALRNFTHQTVDFHLETERLRRHSTRAKNCSASPPVGEKLEKSTPGFETVLSMYLKSLALPRGLRQFNTANRLS